MLHVRLANLKRSDSQVPDSIICILGRIDSGSISWPDEKYRNNFGIFSSMNPDSSCRFLVLCFLWSNRILSLELSGGRSNPSDVLIKPSSFKCFFNFRFILAFSVFTSGTLVSWINEPPSALIFLSDLTLEYLHFPSISAGSPPSPP